MDNPSMGMKEWSLLIVLSLLWGGSFFFNKVVLLELTPLTVVLGRTGFAAIALLLIVYGSGQQMPTQLSIWRAFCVMGFLNNLVPFTLIVWGQQYIDSGLASIFNATTPLFTVFLAHFFTHDEHLTWNRVLGILSGILGVIILIGWEALKTLSLQSLAQMAILGAACSYGFAGIYGRRFKEMSPIIPAAGMLTASTVMMAPLALWIEKPWQLAANLITWSALLGTALLSTALAYLIYFRILAVAGATNLLLVTFLIPPSALLLGVLVLGESLHLSLLVGMVLIFAGLAAVDGRLFKKFVSSRKAKESIISSKP